jgi:5'(3')-deoxyribonucleotidase
MNSLAIGVDVDDVCADLLGEWLRRYNVKYSDKLLPEDLTKWELEEQVKPECGSKIFSILTEPDLYNHVLPIPGARAGVDYLRSLGRVVFVTAGAFNGGAKFAWLKRWGFLPSDGHHESKDFVCAYDKNLIRLDALIDDRVSNVESFPGLGLLMTRPHNRLVGTGVTRINALDEAQRFIQAYF